MSIDPEYVKAMRNRTVQLEHQGDFWTDEDREILKRGFDSGLGITALAVLLQRSEHGITQQIEVLDLYNRKGNPMRRRAPSRPNACLCDQCALYQAPCPNWDDCKHFKEEA